MKQKLSIKLIAVLGVFAAVAFALTALSRVIPAFIPSVPFLKYDPKDFVIVIAGFLFGPLPAFILTVVVSFIEYVTVSTTGLIGLAMNVLATSFFVLPAAFIYQWRRKLSGAVLGLIAGVIGMTGIMLLWNYLITPLYMTVSRDVVAKLLLPAFLPFNLIKAGLNAGFALLFYKPIVTALRRAHVMEDPGKKPSAKNTVWVLILGVFLLVSALVAVLVFNH